MLTDTFPLPAVLPPILLSLVTVAGLVISDLRGWRQGRYLCKPLAALAFIWLALNLDATATTYGQIMLVALALCLLGDLCLMPEGERWFLAGLGAFLCGHLVFAIAFAQLPWNDLGWWLTALVLAPTLFFVWRWIQPNLDAAMKAPVAVYILVITAMLLCAGLTAGHPAALVILPGAWGFAISDLSVAHRQFIDPAPQSGVWGTPAYFWSQMLLAASVALV